MADQAAAWRQANDKIAQLKNEIARVIVGQDQVVEQLLTALLSRGHCLIVGVPGLAKTLLVSTIGKIMNMSFARIQFTPDMMPSDITGCEILQEDENGRRNFEFVHGPVFANLILADEINRTPPKTQAALLEAMQEKQVTAAGRTMALPDPFVVFATQNPIEHEGTYPLPEAQLDRFFFCLTIGYPEFAEEREIVLRTTGGKHAEPTACLSAEELTQIQNLVGEIPVPDHILDYLLRLVSATRPESPYADDYVKKYVAWGAGPRASQNLTRAAKALAMLRGRPAIGEEEVREVAVPVLRHRVIPNYNAVGEGVEVEAIIEHLLREVK